jgi:hypothetical protein
VCANLVRRLNRAGTGTIGFLDYSGHGAAEKGTNINYLIPVNAKEPGTDAFWDDSVRLDDVLRLLDGARSAAKLVIFDGCRNELQLPTKDTSKSEVPVTEHEGMFVAYASSPGRTASDRGDKSGVCAPALAAELLRPGLDHLNMFQNIKESGLAELKRVGCDPGETDSVWGVKAKAALANFARLTKKKLPSDSPLFCDAQTRT